MTLTSLLPTLRQSLPAPLEETAWPAGTHASPRDVVISGVSMLRLAEICTTPCVYSGAAVIPFSGGTASPLETMTVVVSTVTGVDATGACLDACFDLHRPMWSESRLLGRVSHAREIPLDLHGVDGESTRVRLPGDLHPGDVLAVPCADCFSVGDVRADRER
ncbi:hypothetical protein QE374_002137 [Microbacterium sp. SORGH_AS428]|uniref:hypothetical protein n=1 Tax=Microbacterium sp. SORGH_AS_0428 TaxID=3041788 RepID=UPI00285927C5|nr:hypothetical protein [Microbacterium sp. SORGH_AS_0428]MDR6200228.1 hypothetical protein [Microbacterium sp. SORGH_AS_0428]